MAQDPGIITSFVNAYLGWVGAPLAAADESSGADHEFERALTAYLDDLRANDCPIPIGLEDIAASLSRVHVGHDGDQRAYRRLNLTGSSGPPDALLPFEPYPDAVLTGRSPSGTVGRVTHARTLVADSWHREEAEPGDDE